MSGTQQPAASGLSPLEMEFSLAKMRIENSSQYVGRMIWLITLIAGLISVLVVVSVVLLAVIGIFSAKQAPPIPDVLANWGGIILGFYFGQFVNLVKDFMGIVSGSSLPPSQNAALAAAATPAPPP